ncbi:MAG: hypothetical protein Q4D71_08840, partial [Oscillospiraceae bacterium]|nr:hypothetical protein [Oscillospiraceae bacterium]
KPIRVSIKSDEIKKAAEDASTAPVVVHIEDDNTAMEIENTASKTDSGAIEIEKPGVKEETAAPGNGSENNIDAETGNTAQENKDDKEDGEPAAQDHTDLTAENSSDGTTGTNDGAADDAVNFEADSFSIYAVVYTVDFHWEVDGKTFEYSLPGGGFVTLQQLVEVLSIANSDVSSENTSNEEGNRGNFSKDNDDYSVGEVPGVEDSGTNAHGEDIQGDGVDSGDEQVQNALTLADVTISDKTKKFVANIESVEFSNPDLVWVGKADESIIVGGLKDTNGLDCEYSTELTEKQIDEINNSTVESGDWALISVQPFTSQENLTVTMKNGDQFVIKVTDYQIQKDFITASGEIFEITVTYGEDAQIPVGATLEITEFAEDSEE